MSPHRPRPLDAAAQHAGVFGVIPVLDRNAGCTEDGVARRCGVAPRAGASRG